MKKIIFLAIIALTFWNCAIVSQNYRSGTKAAVNKNWDEAVEYYEKAVIEQPNNSVYRLALLRAKIAASLSHLHEARMLASQGKKEEALDEYEIALSYDPSNTVIAEEAKSLAREEVKEEKPEKKGIELPVKLQVREEKIQLKFIEASLRSIYQVLAKSAKINIIFDQQFRDAPFSINLIDMSFEQAINSLCLTSKNFCRIIDEKTIIIAPDQPAKRLQYELNAIKTFYLSNIKAEETRAALQQMLRTQYRMPVIFVDKNLNSITIKDTPAGVTLAGKILTAWDKPKGEVVIDLEIMEVSRTRLRQLGFDLGQHLVGFKYSGGETSEEGGWLNLSEIDFSKTKNFQITLPSSFVQFLEQDTDTKIVSQPRLRGIEGEEIQYLVGDKIPIPRTTFTPIAAGGISQQPVTSFVYEDVGIDVKITPKIHFEKEITLELEIKIKSLGGVGFANIPIISTREVKNVIRLKDGETNLLAGLLKDEERKTLKGIAGLKNIPILGSLFSNTDQTIQQTDVILTITPHIIRTIPLGEEDLKPLWANLGEISPSGGAIPRASTGEQADLELQRERMLQEQQRRREEEKMNLVFLNPSDFEVPQNREFRISVNLRSQEEIGNMSLNISFNSQVLNLKEVVKGGLINQLGEKPPFLKNIDNSSGVCTIGFSSPDVSKGLKGTGRVASLVFQSKSKGESTVSVTGITANGPGGQTVSFETREARVRVR